MAPRRRTWSGRTFEELAQRRNELEDALTELDLAIEGVQREAVNKEQVRNALAHVAEVFETLPPYRRKDLIRLVLDRAEVSETELRLAIKGRPPTLEVLKRGGNGSEPASRSETSKWLLG